MSLNDPVQAPIIETSSRAMSRRGFLAATGGVLAAGALGSAGRAAAAMTRGSLAKGGTLNIYTWADYFSQSNLSTYKKQTGTTLNISTYDSNDVLFAKLNSAAGSGFDIVVPTSGWIPIMAQHGLLAKLDHDRIPLGDIEPSLLNKVYDPGNHYSIPKDYGVLGVIYDPVACGGQIKTWQDFLDAGTRKAVSGKIQLSASGWEVLGIAMWAAGDDWNTQNTTLINKAGATMKGFAKHVKEFSGFDVNGIVNGSIVLSQCDQSIGRQALLQNSKLRWVVPGPTSELWVDNYAITAHAPDPNQAYSFLNFQLQPAHQIADTEFIGYPTALPNLRGRLPRSTKLITQIFGGPGVDLDKLVSFIVHPSVQGLYESLETEIQAAASGG